MMGQEPRAWAGLPEAPQPTVRHFHLLEEASAFLEAAGGGRALGFFSSVSSAEHTVFLTVAKQLGIHDEALAEEAPPTGVHFGRATVGRGTSGATVYIAPRATVVAANGSAIRALLVHEFRVPATPRERGVAKRWREAFGGRRSGASSASGPSTPATSPPPPPSAWQQILEAEAVSLHEFLSRGALADASELSTEATLETLHRESRTISLLLLPPGLNPTTRAYYIRRLARVASRLSPLRCTQDESSDARGGGRGRRADGWRSEWTAPSWASGRAICAAATEPSPTRFAYSTVSVELTAMLTVRLQLRPTSFAHLTSRWRSPHGRQDVQFAVLERSEPSDAAKPWTMHVLQESSPSERVVEGFVRRRLGLPPSASHTEEPLEREGGGGDGAPPTQDRQGLRDEL